MPVKITNFSAALLKLAIHLAVAAYEDDFSEFNGEILYCNRSGGFLRPVFYVYKLDGNLWIVNRGSITIEDYLSCAEFNETTTQYGTFHLGAYEAAMYTLAQVKKYIEDFDGTIYFTGHSYGATVAPILATICMQLYPNKDLNAFAFGPLPMMDDETNAKYKDKMVSIVNSWDLVPTLSVGNLYERLKLLIPYIKEVDEQEVINTLQGMLDMVKWFISDELYNAIRRDIPEVTDAILGYSHGEVRLVRYPAGHVYQISQNNPKKIEECEIDPPVDLNKMSIYPLAMTYHPDKVYMWAVDAIPENNVRPSIRN